MNFSKRSFHFAIISIVLMVVFLALSIINRNDSTSLDSLVGYMITLFFVTVIIGFICAMLSLKEKTAAQKYVGLIINVVLAILLTIHTMENLSTVAEVFS
jgi:heme A synthase